jgi:hypothetical protein
MALYYTEHLNRADEFRVHMPDGGGPLSHGRKEFLGLPGVEVRPLDRNA